MTKNNYKPKTKKEIIKIVAQNANVTITVASKIVDYFLEVIINEVAKGEKVSLNKFGIFELVVRQARSGRNPQTGAPINIAESKTPKFKPASEFKKQVNPGN